ncbi:MAG: LolA family protein [Gemmatimonadota bacterium]
MPGLLLTYTWLALLLATGRIAPDAGPSTVEPAPPAAEAAPAGVPDAVAPRTQSPDSILQETARVYRQMRSIRATFTQAMENRLLGRTTRSEGTLYQRTPDRFLMDFSDPEGDLIVSDGRYFWMYFPSVDSTQVIRAPHRHQGLDLQAQFIGDVTERFDATYHGREEVRGRTTHVMTLDPRPEVGYRLLKVWIDAEDHLVRQFELTESNGNLRRLELRDVTVNPSLPDDLFEFTPPADALVVDQG